MPVSVSVSDFIHKRLIYYIICDKIIVVKDRHSIYQGEAYEKNDFFAKYSHLCSCSRNDSLQYLVLRKTGCPKRDI